ncbi:MAG: hypoxanthine phosphoribosyltransferase [Deltaproteobacteria bacterium]|nr:MAG: hypoxanthine phosphoribosyltransferase [Deltaproteobacteria bacterium]
MCEKELVFTRDVIQERIKELGKEISGDYAGRELVLIGVLNGAFVFMADLMRSLDIPVQVDFVRLASYGSKTESTGEVRFTKDIELPITDKNVLVVEDIIDTGHTLSYFNDIIALHKPRSIKVCALISKTGRRKTPIVIDYVGFELERGFLIGYGLDYNENYRHLPDICSITINTPDSAS